MKKFDVFSLQNRYIPALLFIACLATAYYLNDMQLMNSIKNDARIINLSGKQRMYSQRLVVLAHNYVDHPSSANLEKLSETIVFMKNNHSFLRTQIHSKKLQEIYTNGQLDRQMEQFFKTLYQLVEQYNPKQLQKLSVQSQNILNTFDMIVSEYEKADYAKVQQIEQKEHYIYVMILITLLFVALFIFYPASKQIARNTKELEEAIAEKTKELQKSIDIISDYVIYSRTDLKGKITYASKEFSNVSGYSNEELVGSAHNIVRHPDMPKEAFSQMWKIIQTGKSWQGEVKNRTKDGGFYWVDARISPEYDKDGNMIGYAAVRHNITLQKEIEAINKDLEKTIKKEVEKNRQKDIQLHEQAKLLQMSEMIGNIAHQWRQPLSAISMASSGLKLKKEIGVLDDEEFNTTLDQIVHNTKNLSKTIDTFSGFINYKKHKSEFCLQEKVEDALEIIEKSLNNHHIELEKQYDVHKIFVTNYASLLSQALLNILTNAKETLIKREVLNPKIIVHITSDDERACICIEDNGGGIDADKLGRIFDPYFTTKHQSVGTGMGLHHSYNIVANDLNGELYANNSDKGARFFIEIPL